MQIQSGKLYENRTWKYLYPCLKYYGADLMGGLSNFFKLAVGVRDFNRKDDSKGSVYILIDTNIALVSDIQRKNYKDKFSKFLDWLSYQHYYCDDYIFEKDKHMLVLKLPDKYNSSYLHFIKGEYSQMYNHAELRDYFKYISIDNRNIELKQNNKIKNTRSILTKDKDYLQVFVDKVNKDFNTKVNKKEFVDAELDYPPNKEEEILILKRSELLLFKNF